MRHPGVGISIAGVGVGLATYVVQAPGVQLPIGVLLALGLDRCVAIGSGANDIPMLEAAALGIAVLGPEGTNPRTLAAADVVAVSITHALDLLLDTRALTAILRP